MENATKPKLTPVFEMVEAACREYWKSFGKFIEIYLRGLAGILPVIVLGLFMPLASASLPGGLFVLYAVLFGLSILAAIYFGVRIRAAMVIIIKDDYKSAKESFQKSGPLFWGFLWVSIIATVLIVLLSLLLVVPGIIFWVFWSLYIMTFIFEGYKGYSALKRSLELVSGFWWAVFGRLLFIALLGAIVDFILGLPISGMEEKTLGFQLYDGFVNLIFALLAPIGIIYNYYIFRDLVKIKGSKNA